MFAQTIILPMGGGSVSGPVPWWAWAVLSVEIVLIVGLIIWMLWQFWTWHKEDKAWEERNSLGTIRAARILSDGEGYVEVRTLADEAHRQARISASRLYADGIEKQFIDRSSAIATEREIDGEES